MKILAYISGILAIINIILAVVARLFFVNQALFGGESFWPLTAKLTKILHIYTPIGIFTQGFLSIFIIDTYHNMYIIVTDEKVQRSREKGDTHQLVEPTLFRIWCDWMLWDHIVNVVTEELQENFKYR